MQQYFATFFLMPLSQFIVDIFFDFHIHIYNSPFYYDLHSHKTHSAGSTYEQLVISVKKDPHK